MTEQQMSSVAVLAPDLKDLGRFSEGIENLQPGQLLTPEQEVELGKVIQLGRLIEEQASENHPHSPEDLALIDKARRGRQIFVEHNLGLIGDVIKKYIRYWGDLAEEDLKQEGALGLIKAAEKFDPNKGVKFSTYAFLLIRKQIDYAVIMKGRSVHIPEYVATALSDLAKVTENLLMELGREPSDNELAQAMGISSASLKELYQYRKSTISLDIPVGEDGQGSLYDLLGEQSPAADEYLWRHILAEELGEFLGSLSDVELAIVNLIYGLGGEYRESKDIAELLGISVDSVKRIRSLAQAKLGHTSMGAHQLVDKQEGDEWRDRAACKALGYEPFFLGKMGPAASTKAMERAKSICNQCEARSLCGEYAIKNNISVGVWGGMSPRERR